MPKIICTVPERALSTTQLLTLESALRTTYSDYFDHQDRITVLWYRLPDGQSYVAGSVGDVFIALIEVDDGLEQSKREDVMMAFTKTFSKHAHIRFDKPLVSVLDSSKVNEYLRANRARLRWRSRLRFLAGTMVHAYRSRKRDGFASIRANL